MTNKPEIVKLLLSNGAQIDIKDNKGKTPLDLGIFSNFNLSFIHLVIFVTQLLKKKNETVASILISKNADLKFKDDNTVLHMGIFFNMNTHLKLNYM